MLFSLFHFIAKRPTHMVNEVCNLFKDTQKIVIIEAGLNLVFSLILIYRMGISGVILATVLSTLLTNFWAFPYVIYNKTLEQKPFKYYYRYLFSVFISIIFCFLSDKFVKINSENYLYWFLNSAAYFLIVCIIVFSINFITSKDFRSIVSKGLNLMKNYNN